MDPEAAQLLLLAITAAAVIVWLLGFRYIVGSYRMQREGDDLAGASSGNLLSGRVEVEGQPGFLATRGASILAKASPFGPVKIVDKTDDHITFERLGPGVMNQQAGRLFRRGTFRFSLVNQGRTRVEWLVELANMGWLLAWGALFQVLGLIAIVRR